MFKPLYHFHTLPSYTGSGSQVQALILRIRTISFSANALFAAPLTLVCLSFTQI